jgi:hypothetical protein
MKSENASPQTSPHGEGVGFVYVSDKAVKEMKSENVSPQTSHRGEGVGFVYVSEKR